MSTFEMFIKFAFVFCFLLAVCGICPAQSQFAVAFGTPNLEYAFPVIQTLDGGYAMTGYTYLPSTGGYDLILVKFDASGNLSWAKAVTTSPGQYNYGYSLIQMADGSYIVSGATCAYASDFDIFLLKFNSTGNLIWAKAIGDTGMAADYGYWIIKTNDGGYAIAGDCEGFGAFGSAVFLMKFSSADVLQWTTLVDGTNSDVLTMGAPSLIQTADGGYAVNGYTMSFGAGWWDFFFIKFTSAGAVSWVRTIGEPPVGAPDWGYSLDQTIDGGYVLTGHTANFGAGMSDLLLVKFNSAGTFQWATTVGGTQADGGNAVIKTPDGGCIATGFTMSYGAGGQDLWIVKFTAAGGVPWARRVGGPSPEYGHSIIQTNDGGYAVGGITYSFGDGSYDFFLVKFDNNGYSCTGTDIQPTVMSVSPTVMNVSPNVINASPRILNVSPTVYDITPTLTFVCPVTCTLTATASSNSPICEGDTLKLFGGPSGMANYQWSGPGGFSSTLQNPIRPNATMAMGGTYTLIVTDFAGCADTVSIVVTVNYRPYVYCMASGECVGDTIRLLGGGPVSSYTWTGPNGFYSTLMNPIIPNATLANTGWYYFTGTGYNGCSNTCSVYVEIINCGCPQPVAWIRCPYPCWNFSSCSTQSVIFGLYDTSGAGIDTMALYFTYIIHHPSMVAETTHLYEPTPFINYSSVADTIFAQVWGNWTDGDSVWVIFDSLSCFAPIKKMVGSINKVDTKKRLVRSIRNEKHNVQSFHYFTNFGKM